MRSATTSRDCGCVVIAAARVEQTPSRAELRALPAPAPTDLGVVAERWQWSLDATQRALDAARAVLGGEGLHARQRALAAERQVTGELLVRLGRETGSRTVPWLSSVPVDTRMLRLPATVRACLFDLDGVLTDSGSLHAWAWSEVFDPLLLRLSQRAGWAFKPFDRVADYRDFVDGRPRLDGIHTFLASRGIRLREGRRDDPADADTACGLARRKGEKLAHGLAHRGVGALPGAGRYLEAARRAGLACCVVSASTTTLPMLEVAELERLVDERADAELLAAESLRPRPAPDLLMAVCARLGVSPAEAATLTHTPAGVAAGHAGGLLVLGIGSGEIAETLRGVGADLVAPSLESLLEPRLRAAA
jgi:beta-phosphoglucomutase-like phosphatase (HAD superfamily)